MLCTQNAAAALHQIFVSRHAGRESSLASAWAFKRDTKALCDGPCWLSQILLDTVLRNHGGEKLGYTDSGSVPSEQHVSPSKQCTEPGCLHWHNPLLFVLPLSWTGCSTKSSIFIFQTAGLLTEGMMNVLAFVGCQTQRSFHLVEALGCETSETWSGISPSRGRSRGDTFLLSIVSASPEYPNIWHYDWWPKPLLSGSSLTLLFTVIKMEIASDRHEHHFTSSSLNYLLLSTALPLSVWWEKYVFRTVILKSKYLNHQ